MNNIVEIEISRFIIAYFLLLIVLAVMKKCKIKQIKLLFISTIQMTIQLILAGYLLTYIFKQQQPVYTIFYVFFMMIFAIYRVISKNKSLNMRFKFYIVSTLSISGISIIAFFIIFVINENIFNPQYTIPLSGMIFGNVMTGLNLGLKTFQENLQTEREKLEALLNFGGKPSDILQPLVSRSLETALLPTLNSMIGLGIVSLPGMMTGQILSGTPPKTAILYQIVIMIAICTVVCLSVFGSLYFGHRTLYNQNDQFEF